MKLSMGGHHKTPRRLSFQERFLFYGLCGITAEVFFTGLWEAIENGEQRLVGVSSVYAFGVYAVAILVIEQLFFLIQDRISLLWRGILYMFIAYTAEFSLGAILRMYEACPWDYSTYFRYHFLGLVTAEYIPVWYLGSIFAERVVIDTAHRLAWLGLKHD